MACTLFLENLSLFLGITIEIQPYCSCISYFFLLLYSRLLNIPQFVPLSMITFGLLGCDISLCRNVLLFFLCKGFELQYLGLIVDVQLPF